MIDYYVGQIVNHPKFGEGTITHISEKHHNPQVTVQFTDVKRVLDPTIATLEVVGEDEFMKMKQAFREVIHEEIGENVGEMISDSVKSALQKETGDSIIELKDKWIDGEVIIKPGRGDLKEKVIPISTLFHKIVLIRDRLRMLEQNINSSNNLNDDEKVHLQQYITRCYGSLTTFNVLFANDENKFIGQSRKRKK